MIGFECKCVFVRAPQLKNLRFLSISRHVGEKNALARAFSASTVIVFCISREQELPLFTPLSDANILLLYSESRG